MDLIWRNIDKANFKRFAFLQMSMSFKTVFKKKNYFKMFAAFKSKLLANQFLKCNIFWLEQK